MSGTYATLRQAAEKLAEMPGIGKVEIAGGNVIVTMPPVNRHEHAVARLCRQLTEQVAKTHPGYVAHPGADLEDPGLGRLRCPDVMVFPESSLEGPDLALRPDEVLLVVEIVSRSNPENDYLTKVEDYAAMGIPHYVLVDPRDGTGIVHSQPGYAQRTPFVFGDTVSVGPWKLDTSVLLTYGPPRSA
jgi:Uma2 family endonuclease